MHLAVVIVAVILIALVVSLMVGFPPPGRVNSLRASLDSRRENYGPPPGMYRALHHEELGDRGWPSYPYEYSATTASAISHMIERSA